MGLIVIVIAGAVILLIGFLAGARFEEHNLERRERALAEGRRRERELLARRARELEGRSGRAPEGRSIPSVASAERASALTAPRELR